MDVATIVIFSGTFALGFIFVMLWALASFLNMIDDHRLMRARWRARSKR